MRELLGLKGREEETIMRRFILKYILLLIICLMVQNSYSQENEDFYKIHLAHKSYLLDGVYIKENSPTRKVVFNSKRTNLNSFIAFEIKKVDSFPLSEVNDYLSYTAETFEKQPIQINDCIYFDPLRGYLQTFDYSYQVYSIEEKKKKWKQEIGSFPSAIAPNSIRFNINIEDLKIIPKQEVLLVDSNPISNFKNYFRPFYFRKFEVTNGEYREFVNWVKDSIIKIELINKGYVDYGERIINNTDTSYIINLKEDIDTKDWNTKKIMESFYKEIDNTFYITNTFKTELLNYPIEKELISIYPDTLTWVKDFSYSYNEPMTNAYFWHPYYNDHPVVGVTFYQAKAFLKWKTIQHQKKLDEENINYKVNYELPTDLEWDMAATASMGENGLEIYKDYYSKISDQSWVTNLNLWRKDGLRIDSVNEEGYSFESYIANPMDRLLSVNNNLLGVEASDGAMFTIKSNVELLSKSDKKKIKPFMAKDELGICFMGGNVSEWLQDSYKDQWKPIFDMRQKQLATFDTEEQHLISAIEQYYDKNNDTNGVLVRGANWFDERYSNTFGRNIEGVNAKVFVNPDSAYSTLGFRYVVHIEPK